MKSHRHITVEDLNDSQSVWKVKCVFATESLIKSESVISERSVVGAYRIITAYKLWEYSACIYISAPSSPPRLLPLLSLSLILFVSQCLANFALGCNFGSQENAPRLHNPVSRATVVIQLQSEMPRGGVDSQSDTVQTKRPLFPQPFKRNELFRRIAVHQGEHHKRFHMYDKYVLEVIRRRR